MKNETIQSATKYVLELNQVGRQFGSDPPVHALVDVDLRVQAGEWLAITGPSGAGKSTLLNIIGCLDQPTSRQYLFEGIDTGKLSDNERAGLRSRRIGFVFQSFHLLPHRSVLENVMLAEVYRKQSRQGRRHRQGRTQPAGRFFADQTVRRREAAGRHCPGSRRFAESASV